MAGGPDDEQLELRLRYQAKFRRYEIIATSVQLAFPWGALCFIAYMAYLSVSALAGQTTLAKLGLAVAGNVNVNQAFAWLLSALFGGYGLNERRLRRKTVKRLGTENSELAKLIDPKRSSSHLTVKGTTRREDKI